jgi:hypothetical protein
LTSFGDWEMMMPTTDDDDSDDHHNTDDGYNCYRWHHRPSGSVLIQVDQLRLKLQLFRNKPSAGTINTGTNTISSLWIQIPRMYPHRPPVISRLEGDDLWMDRIVVQESPPSVMRGSVRPTVCGSTVVYNQWSPILHIGDLLDFLIQTGLSGRPTGNGNWNTNTNTTDNNNMTTMKGVDHNDDHNDNMGGICVEEHKMDDASTMSFVPTHHPFGTYRSGTPPDLNANRFDVGYGKCEDPLSLSTTTTTSSSNAMEF